MAPVDRREHRQQRVRGAGASTVQASFGFNFGALSAKQASLPPQRSGRRSQTPVQATPRNVNGSARQHRSLSAPRSSKSQRNPTPNHKAATPQLGKRKRASSTTAPDASVEEEDELSPDRAENVRSVEKSRRLARTVSPVLEEPNEAPDELSIIDETSVTAGKSPGLVAGLINGNDASTNSQRRSKSSDIVPVTPGMQPQNGSRHSFVMSTTVENTASNGSQVEDDDADELSPAQDNTATPKVVLRDSIPIDDLEGGDGDIDELSPTQETVPATIASVAQETYSETMSTPIPVRSRPRGRPPKSDRVSGAKSPVTPATRQLERTQRSKKPMVKEVSDNEEPDELSPDTGRTTLATPRLQRRTEDEAHVSDEESEAYEEELDVEDDAQETTPRPAPNRASPTQPQRSKVPSEKPPRKRQKVLGPKLAISVMRMKGYGVRGVTVADTTRTILEEAIDRRLSRMLEKIQTSSDSARRKELRSEVNLALSFKESLNEKLLDLQDANDVLTTNLKKLRFFKRDNAELRKDILALQNGRHEIALEHDDIQAEFETEKTKVEAMNTLSNNMFEIEVAVQNGRKKAQQEGREDEGPDVPLSTLLETVSRDVGSRGGGLLANVKGFNALLERAAGWLEGRA
ncbi:hypothetical protein C7974DRAFT_399144 [Boeremia exigua]|uniref:uncharacterized protein n=1 Tax=Boeremia exigua TaxID=749465 RepID=UPI001E8D7731|nr:uncharacterized protein C7974DRAFT_399144 [Boeremia exigua]KAH6620224.1 hypothetical protein C7974DRAFT_399144 [Boeremia exigua]